MRASSSLIFFTNLEMLPNLEILPDKGNIYLAPKFPKGVEGGGFK